MKCATTHISVEFPSEITLNGNTSPKMNQMLNHISLRERCASSQWVLCSACGVHNKGPPSAIHKGTYGSADTIME